MRSQTRLSSSKGGDLGSLVQDCSNKLEILQWTKIQQMVACSTEPSWLQVANADSSQPAYPSSMAKRQPVEWDKLAAEVKKEEEDEKPDGEAGLQKLFRSVRARTSFLTPPMYQIRLAGPLLFTCILHFSPLSCNSDPRRPC